MIAIVVITHNRARLLEKCISDTLLRTSPLTTEIVVWDNASVDDTRSVLESVRDPRFRVVYSERNVGMNGYARGFAMTSAPYLIELDDDVVKAPEDWDKTLLDAFRRLSDVGFLAADLVDDPYDIAAHYRYRVHGHLYRPVTENGVRLLEGPTGGGCAITSRELSARVGGFRERPGEVFWLEDAEYIRNIEQLGYRAARLADLKVLHTGGPHYTPFSPEKAAYWKRADRRVARRTLVKRVLLTLPFVGRLNRRFAWFEPPRGDL